MKFSPNWRRLLLEVRRRTLNLAAWLKGHAARNLRWVIGVARRKGQQLRFLGKKLWSRWRLYLHNRHISFKQVLLHAVIVGAIGCLIFGAFNMASHVAAWVWIVLVSTIVVAGALIWATVWLIRRGRTSSTGQPVPTGKKWYGPPWYAFWPAFGFLIAASAYNAVRLLTHQHLAVWLEIASAAILALVLWVRWDPAPKQKSAWHPAAYWVGPLALLFVLLVGGIGIAWLLVDQQWANKVTPTVHNMLAVKGWSPGGAPVGDHHFDDLHLVASCRTIKPGLIEISMPARPGWYHTSVLVQPGHEVRGLAVDSTFSARQTDRYSQTIKTVAYSVGGEIRNGHRVYPTDPDQNPLLRKDYNLVTVPKGGLLLRLGSAQPKYVGTGIWRYPYVKHWYWPWGQSREVLFAINSLQVDDDVSRFAGTIRIHLLIVPIQS